MATPILERQTETDSTLALLGTSCSELIETGRLAVTDCPAYAWDESDQRAMYDLGATFGNDLVEAHTTTLTQAAHRLIAAHLATEWRQYGYDVVFVYGKSAFESGATPGPDGVPYAVLDNDTYHQVWQAAANAITDKGLVTEADLGHVFGFRTELGRHRDSLDHKLALLRADLDERLEQHGATAECLQAEQQYEGWRAAVDAAVTREQLLRVSADMPF